MRQLLVALVCLSTFAFAQNVLAISPAPIEAVSGPMLSADGPGAMPPVGSMALLLAGLAGLLAAGRRFEERCGA